MNANGQAPNYGSHVPVNTAPSPVPVYRALKIPASAQAVPNECNRGSTADFSKTAPVDLARPAQQGQRNTLS